MRKLLSCVAILLFCCFGGQVLSFAEDIEIVDEWYVVPISDDWSEVIMKCEENIEIEIPLSAEIVEIAETNWLILQLNMKEQEPLVDYFLLSDLEKVFFSPTHMYSDGECLEYYYVKEKMFLIDNNEYIKWNIYHLSDNAFLWYNMDKIREHMVFFIRVDNE